LIVDARVVFHQAAKLAVDAGAGFVGAPAGFEDRGLRCMEPGHIGNARGGLVAIDAQDRLGVVEGFACLIEEGGALALYKSMPSARIAYISGMRGSL